MPKLIPLSRGLFTIVDDADYPALSRFKWSANMGTQTFYAQRHDVSGGPDRPIRMHRALTGAGPGQQVDHQNGDGLDNRRSNLRLATSSENNASRLRLPHNKSGRRGVHWNPKLHRWEAAIKKDGKTIYLGLFDDLDQAARAYDAAARRLFGEFARPNFPEAMS